VKQFSGSKKWLNDLDSETACRLITVASDVALMISDAGVILDVSLGSDALSGGMTDRWVGKAWADTVTVESRPKVEALLRDAGAAGLPRWRMINHFAEGGANLPVMYAAVKMNRGGQVVAFGRSMQSMANLQQQLVSAQQSMEREYLKLRQAIAKCWRPTRQPENCSARALVGWWGDCSRTASMSRARRPCKACWEPSRRPAAPARSWSARRMEPVNFVHRRRCFARSARLFS
jgi:hypothetical protein